MLFDRTQIRKGMEVFSLDGKKLGKVLAWDDRSFTIERGLFFPKDYVARFQEITSASGDEIRLGLTAEALEEARDDRAEVASPAATARTTMPPPPEDRRTRRVREMDPAVRAAPIPANPVPETFDVNERRAAPDEQPAAAHRDDEGSGSVTGSRRDPRFP